MGFATGAFVGGAVENVREATGGGTLVTGRRGNGGTSVLWRAGNGGGRGGGLSVMHLDGYGVVVINERGFRLSRT